MLGKRRYRQVSLDTWQGDITAFQVDVMVTAANAELKGGGGVDGAIHSAAGPELMEYCRKIGGTSTGTAVITPAAKLPSQFVIHAVGPIYKDGHHEEASLLRSAYQESLKLFQGTQLRHISFPAISAGVYGYPKDAAAEVAWMAIRDWIDREAQERPLRITHVLFDQETYEIYTQSLLQNF